jgi:acetyltransferase-like isoleucine patch superfamily enzyme
MIKKQIEKAIRLRNPLFKFDEGLETRLIISLALDKLFCLLRGFMLVRYFRKPQKILLGKRVRFFNLKGIKFGKWVKIDDNVFLSSLGKGGISIGDSSGIGAFSRLIISTSFSNVGSFIKIGKNVGLGEFAYLGGGGGLEIGDDCIIGQYLSCHPENHNFDQNDGLYRYQGTSRKGIKIGSNCWIGAKVTILDGVQIGDNCVVAAGAVVTKSMPSRTIIGGVPAKVIKRISTENHDDKMAGALLEGVSNPTVLLKKNH